MIHLTKYLTILSLTLTLTFCGKKGDDQEPPTAAQLTYGDSVFYVPDGGDDRIVRPLGSLKGRFTGFPEGIELDGSTGAVNISKSETGLRYRISFIPEGKTDTVSAVILLSGINYRDNIYSLEKNDTLAPPIYNGQLGKAVPGTTGTNTFDDGGGCRSLGIQVNPDNGTIDLQSLIKNGVLGTDPSNGAQKEVDLLYRINDASNKALNKVRVKFYYFDSPQDITADLIQQMKDRKGMFIGVPGASPFFQLNDSGNIITPVTSSNSSLDAAKPRPPCIFIVRRSAKQ